MQNTAIATEESTMLDLVKMVVQKIGIDDYVLLKACTDCKVMSKLLTAERLKLVKSHCIDDLQ